LLSQVQQVFESGASGRHLLPGDGIDSYLEHCRQRYGPRFVEMPGETVKDFIGLLRVLEREPEADWVQVLHTAPELPAVSTASNSLSVSMPTFDTYSSYNEGYRPTTRRRRRRSRGVGGLVGGLFFVAVVIPAALWAFLGQGEEPLEATLAVKYSEVRNGLRLPLEADTLPRHVGDFYSVESRIEVPCRAYVFVVNPAGLVEYSFQHEVTDDSKTRQLQLPGGARMWPITEPEGTWSVILLASREGSSDLNTLAARVQKLEPVPQATASDLITVNGEFVDTQRASWENRQPTADRITEPGFLSALQTEFGAEFEVIRGLAFPALSMRGRTPSPVFELDSNP
jgi:hypothetical protein